MHRLKHMNPRAPVQAVHFGEVSLKDVFDLRGFNLNAKLDIDPDFLKEDDHGHDHGHANDKHDHGHKDHEQKDYGHAHSHQDGAHCDHPSHVNDPAGASHGHHHHHDDDVKSFVFRSDKAFDPAKLEDFLARVCCVTRAFCICRVPSER
jgi:G3E family GTPase